MKKKKFFFFVKMVVRLSRVEMLKTGCRSCLDEGKGERGEGKRYYTALRRATHLEKNGGLVAGVKALCAHSIRTSNEAKQLIHVGTVFLFVFGLDNLQEGIAIFFFFCTFFKNPYNRRGL